MNNKITKVLAILTALTLFIFVAVACSANQGTGNEKETTTTATAAKTTTAQPTETESNLNETGMPIVKEKVTINFLSPQSPTHRNFEELEVMVYLEEQTNVDIEWTMIPLSALDEKRNLILASNELPDVFYGMRLTAKDISNYGSQGVLLKIDPYIDKYAPNVKTRMEKYPDIKRIQTSSDGHIYALGEWSNSCMLWFRPWINQKWLDKLVLKVPDNTDELYTVLKTFKANDCNEDGEMNEIPLADRLDYATFGMNNWLENSLDIRDGKIYFIPTQPEYKSYLEYHAMLYKEGLLDQEVFTRDGASYQARAAQNIYGMGMQAAPPSTASPLDFTLILPPLRGPDGNGGISGYGFDNYGTVNTIGAFAMTKENEYPEVTVRWIDQFYGAEGQTLIHRGFDGKHSKTYEDGTWEYFIPEGMSGGEFLGQYTPIASGNFPQFWDISLVFKQLVNGSIPQVTQAQFDLDEYAATEYLPRLALSQEDQKKDASIRADLDKYVSSMLVKFITSQESFDKWDDYISNCKKMKCDELVSIYQAAYDEIMK